MTNEEVQAWIDEVVESPNYTGWVRGKFTLIKEDDQLRLSKLNGGVDGDIVNNVEEILEYIKNNS